MRSPPLAIISMGLAAAPRRLIWHRRDLRLDDNDLYRHDSNNYSIYVFDPRDFELGSTRSGIVAGPHYTRRLLDAVHCLKKNLEEKGGNLIVRVGSALAEVPSIAQQLDVDEVAWAEVPGFYECEASRTMQNILQYGSYRCNVFTTCTLTLAHPHDLPRNPDTWQHLARPNERRRKKSRSKSGKQTAQEEASPRNIVDITPRRFDGMPTIMGDFRRVARTCSNVRGPSNEPPRSCIAKGGNNLSEEVPSIETLFKPLRETSSLVLECLPPGMIEGVVKSAIALRDEKASSGAPERPLEDLEDFIMRRASSADRSLCDVSGGHSSRLSTPLALGTISPRQVYHVTRRCQERLEDPSKVDWIISHLEMRDYFLFDCFREGKNAFRLEPKPAHQRARIEWRPLAESRDEFLRWCSGRTGLPMVDAGMREMIATGYASNRVRQNMASVLTKDLNLDWRLGADWFQFLLEDHCVAANWGNWAYFSGVGGDPKSRHFRTASQANRYDPDGKYVMRWVEELSKAADVEDVIRPWSRLEGWEAIIKNPDESQLTWQDKLKVENDGRVS